MAAASVGEVVESKHADFQVGELLSGLWLAGLCSQ